VSMQPCSLKAPLAGLVLALASAAVCAGNPTAADVPTRPGAFVALDRACLSAPASRHRALSREAFGLPGELYLDGFSRKLQRTFTLYQPGAGPDGSVPGGEVRMEVVLGSDGRLCGYRVLGSANPVLVKTAAAQLEAIAPFPPMPMTIAAAADALHLAQGWSYRGRSASPSLHQRIDVYGGGGDKHQSGGAQYQLGIPLP